MNRFFKRLVRIGTVLLAVAGLLLLAQWLLLPLLARSATINALESAGFTPEHVEVTAVDFSTLHLRELDLGPLQVPAAQVRYTLGGLMRNRVESIELVGARWQLRWTEDGLATGLRPRAAAEPGPAPFNQLRLTSGQLLLNWRQRQLALPIEGVLDAEDNHLYRMQLQSELAGVPLALHGSIQQHPSAHAQLQLDLGHLPVRIDGRWSPAGSDHRWQVDARWRTTRPGSTDHVQLALLWEQSTAAKEITGDLSVELASTAALWSQAAPSATGVRIASHFNLQGQQLRVLDWDVRASSLTWLQQAVHDLHARGELIDQRLQIAASLRTVGGLQRVQLAGPASLNQWAADGPVSLDVAWQLQGQPPAPLHALLERAGGQLTSLTQARSQGQGVWSRTAAAADGLESGQPGWRFEVQRAQLQVVDAHLQLAGDLQLQGLNALVNVAGQITPEQVELKVLPGARISLESIPDRAVIAGEAAGPLIALELLSEQPGSLSLRWREPMTGEVELDQLQLRTGRVQLEQGERRQWVEPTQAIVQARVELGPRSRVTMTGRTTGPTQWTRDPVRASVNTLAWSGRGQWGGDEPATLQSSIEFAGAQVAALDQSWAIQDISGRVPVLIRQPAQQAGSFTAARLRTGERTLGPVRGQLALDGVRSVWNVTAALSAQAALQAGGELDLLRGDGEFELAMPPVRVTDPAELASWLPEAREFGFVGQASLEGPVRIRNWSIEPEVQLRIEEAQLRSSQWDAAASGIRAQIVLSSVAPMGTPGGQWISVQQARVGDLILRNGEIRFRIEQLGTVFVERLKWDWQHGGQLRAQSFRFDPAAPSIHTELFVEDMSLGQWLTLLAGERVSGEGYLYGRVPVSIEPQLGPAMLSFGEGFLYARPAAAGAEGAGWVQLRDAALIEQVVSQTLPTQGPQAQVAQVRERMVRTLHNFEYNTLRFDLIQENTGLALRVQSHIQERAVEPPLEMHLNITVHNFGAALREALLIKLGTQQALERALDRFWNLQ